MANVLAEGEIPVSKPNGPGFEVVTLVPRSVPIEMSLGSLPFPFPSYISDPFASPSNVM